jgi:hypothetical protein
VINPPDYQGLKIDLNPPLGEAPPKPWWQSVGVMSGIATVLVAGLNAAGVPVPFEAVITVLTGALSVYGRWRATRPISASLTAPAP